MNGDNTGTGCWRETVGYVVHGRGCNPHRSLWRNWWRHNSETI